MTDEAFEVAVSNGVLAGPVRTPRNSARHAGAGSIHDDSTAQKLGFRGGTVAGSLNMEQFPPLLARCLGDRWFQTGGMSLYFKYATTDGEPVQAFAEQPVDPSAADQRIRIWMDDVQGNRVCDGTASVGAPDLESTCRQRIADVQPPQDIRILSSLEVGAQGPTVPTRIDAKVLEQRLSVITEPLPAYTDPTIWGGRIATPALQVRAIRPAESEILKRGRDFGVGLFGGIELLAVNGPVFVEYDYETYARVLAVGETPKTEFFWYEGVLVDPRTGNDVLSMLMMLRFMKASSKLWQ
jgi:hypothetical protein